MFSHLTTRLGTFRLISFCEGVSYVLLMFIAMPLKYLADMPKAVSMAGSLHGLLFVIFACSLALTAMEYEWPMKRSLTAFIAAVLPLGAFFFDRSVKAEIDERYGAGAQG